MLGEILGAINAVSYGVLTSYALRQHLFAFVTLSRKHKDIYVDYEPKHTVSIIIPARNEEKVVGRTLEYMSKLDYPVDKMEILVLNDASTDRTSEMAHEWSSARARADLQNVTCRIQSQIRRICKLRRRSP